jgi:glutamyl-tRNA synthetase
LDKIVKSGARFDIDKARWYNQQYIIAKDNAFLASCLQSRVDVEGYEVSEAFLTTFCGLMKERVDSLNGFIPDGRFFFEAPKEYEEKMIRKKYRQANTPHFNAIRDSLSQVQDWTTQVLEEVVKGYINTHELGFGAILPILRIGVSGTMKGPDLFATMELLGKEEVLERMDKAIAYFPTLTDK